MYKITYDLKTNDGSNTYEFFVDNIDVNDVKAQNELALKDSLKYFKSGMSAIRIIDIELVK
ncbi:hypothetical protein JFB93_11675 [Providencia rettgeri]|uniref:hypothetical protein n=1 Tax=Providencia rettgeri TaxID=587 RepID=UPI0018E86862|nr:hypothetical protein [Providencia rettgeri]QQE91668.1 hypothetical protein JFB93_11675 [Providencia rettgeri]QWJ90127.1 hypothetical protein KM147_11745 [Providencia rettgeri]